MQPVSCNPSLADLLQGLGVKRIISYPDADIPGHKKAANARDKVAGTPIIFDARDIGYEVQYKGGNDIDDLFMDCGRDPAAFIAALESCPPLDVPDQEPPQQRQNTGNTGVYGGAWAEYCEREFDPRVPSAWLQGSPNDKGFHKNTHCPNPGHEDRNASFGYNPESRTGYCFVCGTISTDELAGLIGTPIYERKTSQNLTFWTDLSDPKNAPSRFPGGVPYTIDKRLSTAHKRINGTDKQQHAAAVLYIWHEIPETMIANGVWFKRSDFEHAGIAIGRNPKRDLIEKGLDQLVAWGVIETVDSADLQPVDSDDLEICGKCNLHTTENTLFRLQNQQIFFEVSTLRANTRPTTLYCFKSWSEQLAAIAQHYRYLLREEAFKYDADTVQPEWGDLTADQIAVWDDYRAPVYDADHQRALARFDRQMAYLDNDIAAINRGNNWTVQLPPGDIGNARDYWHLKAQQRTAETDIERGKLARDLGISRAALARSYEQIGVIPIEQTKVSAAESVSDYQWENGLVVRDFGNGKVEVKAPSLLRSIDRASEDDRAAFDALREKQAEIRNLRTDREPDRVEALRMVREHDPDLYPHPEKSLTIPNNYTDDHKRNQYSLFPLLADFPNYDPETGEVPQTIDDLWRAGANWLLARESEGETMPASHYTMPCESEDRAVSEATNEGDPAWENNLRKPQISTGERTPDNRGAAQRGYGGQAEPMQQPAAETVPYSQSITHPALARLRVNRDRLATTTIDGLPYTPAMLRRRAARLGVSVESLGVSA